MYLTRLIKIQLVIISIIGVVAGGLMLFGYIGLPALLGVGRYTVTVQLPQASGLYKTGNVTYRGTQVGRVTELRLTATGVEAVLSLQSDVRIPADLDAEVHSVSGIGEQYVALLPRSDKGADLENGDVIPVSRTSVPTDINSVLDAANRGLQAIPQGDLKTVIDESYTAIGGLGPEVSRIVQGSTQLALDARVNVDALTTLIDRSGPVLDSQADTADSIHQWAAHLADVTSQLQRNDAEVSGLLRTGPAAAEEGRQLIDRIAPTLPVLLANLVSVNPVLITYQPALEQILVLLPEGVAFQQMITLANRHTKHPASYLSFNLNINLPPPCTTGFLPPQQQRTSASTDTPETPKGDLYCRIPQDAPHQAVRGARNYPCLATPGKRAPTAEMCESTEQYVPLNDGESWKGDPNATLSGQDVLPQAALPPDVGAPPASPAPAPIAVAEYDPSTGTYVGPDGRVYMQGDLTENPEGKTWQSMLTPATAP
ncbi:MCE family protein [Mycolicibacterium sp. P9-22]|uniref:MCE family protein n=1 Tax=Mycolicibacterium sp. P9-22 TaxID=2024613 RepID=UPI0011EEBC31|nr:MlaD family protein [Mycolicibacterium sp. P9-22]KAA0120656.1 MCE family protein [Mycolicibacterium sp. P9-22]